MKLLQSLVEAPIPSQYEAGMKRYGMDDIDKQISKAAAQSPEAVIELVRTLAKQGHVDQDTLKELAKVKDVIDRLMIAAKSGKVDVQSPKAGSFYDRERKSGVPKELEDVMQQMVKYASAGQKYKEQLQQVLNAEYGKREKLKRAKAEEQRIK